MSAVALAHRQVSDAAKPYESRWTLRALLGVDKELYHMFREQQQLWNAALVTGDAADIAEQTAAMCRGWQAITQRMDAADIPDDAYLMGFDPSTGTRVAIGDQVAARDRVRELHGEKVIWLTPAECAVLLARTQELAAIKGLFPGAEIIELYPSEPRVA